MNVNTIDSLLKLIKKLDIVKQNNKMTETQKLSELLDVFKDIPLDIKAQLEKMKQEKVKGIDLPKDFTAGGNGRYIESEELDRGNYDDLLVAISGNFLEEDRIKLANAIVYKLNH